MYGQSKTKQIGETNKSERWIRAAIHFPNLGPTIITNNAQASGFRSQLLTLSPEAVFSRRVGHLSPYAIFKASMAENPPEDAQSVPTIPSERNVPRLGVITSDKTLRTSPMLP